MPKIIADVSEQTKEQLKELSFLNRTSMTQTIVKLIEKEYSKNK